MREKVYEKERDSPLISILVMATSKREAVSVQQIVEVGKIMREAVFLKYDKMIITTKITIKQKQ